MVSRESRVLLVSTGTVLLVLVAVALRDVGGASAVLVFGLVASEFWAGYGSTAA